MTFFQVLTPHKKDYLALLLLADESERMVDRYLERGEMYALEDGGRVVCTSVVTDEGEGVLEIKSIAVLPGAQGRGYGRKMIDFIKERYGGEYESLIVGTGDSPMTVPFYEKCGFIRSHVIQNIFTENYDHPIVECGVTLVDMIYLKQDIKKRG